MRPANASLIAFLASRAPSFQTDLFTITLANGSVYAWSNYDQPIQVGPYLYSGWAGGTRGPLIQRTKWGIKNTIDVPEMDVIIKTNGLDLPDGTNLKLLVHNGLFDYSTVTLSRLVMPKPGDASLGAVDLFTGSAAQIAINALSIDITVKGANVQLAQYMPRNQYMQACIHSVYDAGCAPNPGQPGGGPSRAANTFASNVGAASTPSLINWGTVIPPNPTNFSLGYVTFTSGTSNGITRTIGTSTEAGFSMLYPLYQVPQPGDTFTVTYGCQRNQGPNGCGFFNNRTHYRGFPYIPPAAFGA